MRQGRRVDSFRRDGLTFDVRDAGPPDGEPVVLLHGFPQDSAAWDQVSPALHQAGLRTLAPDQRGCSPMARPRGRGRYRLRETTADVLALLDAAGLERAHVVGHDWGGMVAWALAA
jgi:pimeloyl-ACP methyl ester carboxylesterase